MSYLNSVTLVGFVGSDPEQRQAQGNGSKFTVLSVATQRSWKSVDDEWSSKTEWHRVVVIWNQDTLSNQHGRLEGLSGRLRDQCGPVHWAALVAI
jgi:single stranded DNA-binding protein